MASTCPCCLCGGALAKLWTARQFHPSAAEVEDLYDETIVALVEKGEAYESEEHLRAALHRGIKMRALRLHRDRQVRALTLEHAAPVMDAAGQDEAWRAARAGLPARTT